MLAGANCLAKVNLAKVNLAAQASTAKQPNLIYSQYFQLYSSYQQIKGSLPCKNSPHSTSNTVLEVLYSALVNKIGKPLQILKIILYQP